VDEQNYRVRVSEDQLQEVLRSLDNVKVPVKQEDGSWSFWLDRAIKVEAQRSSLREAEERYRNELMDIEERELLLDRIRRLSRALGILVG
jgi:hypothetical protein